MDTVLLTNEHIDAVRPLFDKGHHTGFSNREPAQLTFQQMYYEIFCNSYLSNLKNYKAFGTVENGKVTSCVTGYESIEMPEWYWTHVRSTNFDNIKYSLDKMIEYQEGTGKLKFYSMVDVEYKDSFTASILSGDTATRYDFVDEFLVPAKTKCTYSAAWQILFNRMLLPFDSLIRCGYLKQDYRSKLSIAGNI